MTTEERSTEERTVDRVKLVAEAHAIEAAGGEWRVKLVMAVLDCARSTVYDTPWLRRIAKRVGKRGLRFVPAEVRARGPITLKKTAS